MKSTWFGNRRRYEFAQCLREADYGANIWDLFSTWLDCALAAIRQPVRKLVTGSIDATIEEKYMRQIKRVKTPSKFAECLGILTDSLTETSDDFLGQTLSELDMNDKSGKGQCFTPASLCEAMARMTVGEIDRNSRDYRRQPLMISEPACGGGAMVIATTKALREAGWQNDEFYWVANDVDWRMFATCYIQCQLLDIPATVMHANTLSLEQWDSEITFAGFRQKVFAKAWKSKVDSASDIEQLSTNCRTIVEQHSSKKTQGLLFQ